MLQQDTLFANRYQLRSLIGRGGFSEVWLAHDTWTDLDIAIKVYAPGQGLDSDGLKEFCQELAGVHHLTHPNLLKPDHVDQWENMPYLIMEYCPKGALSKQVGKLSEKQVWKVLHDVAAGLAYLHSKDIVHQDIKPDNILLDESGNYRITDFGISTKARTTLRKSMLGASTSGGTMAYMGPERFSAQPAPTKASDIWSLGAMIYELITGDVPFGEIGGGMQKNGAEIPDIAQPISPALTQVIHLMLAKETWDRPTAETLVTWAANPSLVKPVEPTKSASEGTTAAAGGRPTATFSTADLPQKTYSVANSTTTQRVATPPAQPKPQVKTPDAPDKPKRNKTVTLALIVCIGGIVMGIGTYCTSQSKKLQEKHLLLCASIDEYFSDTIWTDNYFQRIDKIRSTLSEIQQIESSRNYHGQKYSCNVEANIQNIMKRTYRHLAEQCYGRTRITTPYAERHRQLDDFITKAQRYRIDIPNYVKISNNDIVAAISGISFCLVHMESGTFTMGDDYSWTGAGYKHDVTLSNYWIAQTETTQELWLAVMGTKPSHFIGNMNPVECVSWDDCQRFITNLNRLFGNCVHFDLPTEAQWEFAARCMGKESAYIQAGTTLKNTTWYSENSNERSHPVATKECNSMGLYDMSGNVHEWCKDFYGPYSKKHEYNPKGPDTGREKVFRGSSWSDGQWYCTIGAYDVRGKDFPEKIYTNVGFRIVVNNITDKASTMFY